jgi:hypothetical protein
VANTIHGMTCSKCGATVTTRTFTRTAFVAALTNQGWIVPLTPREKTLCSKCNRKTQYQGGRKP